MVSYLTACQADISLAISTGHIMCYRHSQTLALDRQAISWYAPSVADASPAVERHPN